MGAATAPYNPKDSKTADESEKIFQSSLDEVEQAFSEQRNIFISFDMEDEAQVTLLRIQAKDDRFPFEFRDYSVKEPFEEEWKAHVTERINHTSAVIVMIGENTHLSKAVDWEIREAHKQNKPVFGIRISKGENHPIPQALIEFGDPVINWDTRLLGERLTII
jgi:hypothetical protein